MVGIRTFFRIVVATLSFAGDLQRVTPARQGPRTDVAEADGRALTHRREVDGDTVRNDHDVEGLSEARIGAGAPEDASVGVRVAVDDLAFTDSARNAPHVDHIAAARAFLNARRLVLGGPIDFRRDQLANVGRQLADRGQAGFRIRLLEREEEMDRRRVAFLELPIAAGIGGERALDLCGELILRADPVLAERMAGGLHGLGFIDRPSEEGQRQSEGDGEKCSLHLLTPYVPSRDGTASLMCWLPFRANPAGGLSCERPIR